MWSMPNNNFGLAEGQIRARLSASAACLTLTLGCLLVAGCATPQYTVRPTSVPDESPWAHELERTISAYQAHELERPGARPVYPGERWFEFDLQRVVNTLSRVTERPSLPYRVRLLDDQDPNAVALADGRVYVTTGMLKYLASRGSKDSELAFIIAHELAHTVAQHLVTRYRQLQQQQMMLALVGLGTAVATRGEPGGQEVGQLVQDVASLVNDVIASGYSQEQELEADQLGIRYCIRAGYDPWAAVALLEDFTRFDVPWPFLRTHPYIQRRAEDLKRYLLESGVTPPRTPMQPARVSSQETRKRLLEAQRLYPVGSRSWNNIQQQLDALDHKPR